MYFCQRRAANTGHQEEWSLMGLFPYRARLTRRLA